MYEKMGATGNECERKWVQQKMYIYEKRKMSQYVRENGCKGKCERINATENSSEREWRIITTTENAVERNSHGYNTEFR